jgi:chemotaxis protein methyltransferase CheR
MLMNRQAHSAAALRDDVTLTFHAELPCEGNRQMNSQDIDAIFDLVMDLCGIYLDQSKTYLIESHLSDLISSAGCSSYTEFAFRARASRQLQHDVINAITINETLFFRDGAPFEALRHKVLPELIDAKTNSLFPKRIRIWSAACSTGQEPYTIAMVLRELIPDVDSWDIRITATDISDDVIQTASRGRYSQYEIGRGLPPTSLNRHFVPDDGGWRVKDELRGMIHFQRINLLEPYVGLGQFDVVFCRNVAIYFTRDAQRDLYQRIAKTMAPDGYLFVGSSESLMFLGPEFRPHNHCRSVFYRPTLTTPAGISE